MIAAESVLKERLRTGSKSVPERVWAPSSDVIRVDAKTGMVHRLHFIPEQSFFAGQPK